MPLRRHPTNPSLQQIALALALAHAIALVLCTNGMAQAATTDIYRSYESNGVTHSYSDHPINRSSRLFAVFDGFQLWPRSGTGPFSTAELIIRRAELDPLVQRAATAHGIHAALLKAVIEVESGFNAKAL